MADSRSVVLVGHVCVDELVTREGVVRAPGSPAVFMAPVLSASGLDSWIDAPHGSDFDALGTDLRMLEPARGDSTLLYVNDVRTEKRMQWVRRAETAHVGESGPAARAALARADALVLTPLLPIPPRAVRSRTDLLPPHALRALLVQGYLRRLGAPRAPAAGGGAGDEPALAVFPRPFAEADEVLPLVDVVVLSDEDLGDRTRSHEAAAGWATAHPATAVVVTGGARGALAHVGGEVIEVPAHPIGDLGPAALVGAGDVFGAALTSALLDAPHPRTAAADPAALAAAIAHAHRETARVLAAR